MTGIMLLSIIGIGALVVFHFPSIIYSPVLVDVELVMLAAFILLPDMSTMNKVC